MGRARPLAAALGVTTGAILPALLVGTLGERITTALRLGEVGLGLVLALFFATSALLAPVGGRLADRLGWPRAIRLAGATVALGLLMVAVLGGDPGGLGAGLVVGGAGMAVAMPAGSRAVAVALPATRRGLVFGVKQAAIPLAGLLAGVAVPVVALTVGWRWAFLAAVPVPVVAAVLGGGGLGGDRDRGDGPGVGSLPAAYRALGAGAAAAAAALAAMSAFVVVAAVRAGVDEGTAGWLVAAGSGLGLVVRVGSGWLADRWHDDGLAPAAGMLMLGAVGLGLLAVGSPPTVVAGTLLAYGVGWGWPGLFYLGAVTHHERAPGVATAAVQVGLSGGSAVGPLAFGLLVARDGFGVAWGAAAIAMFLGGVLVAAARRRLAVRPRRARQ